MMKKGVTDEENTSKDWVWTAADHISRVVELTFC